MTIEKLIEDIVRRVVREELATALKASVPTPPGAYLTTKQTAEWLSIAEVTLAQWRASGKGPPWRRVGRRCIYDRAAVQAWIEKGGKAT